MSLRSLPPGISRPDCLGCSFPGRFDAGYFNALVRMFEQALESSQQDAFVERLERVRSESHNWGWGVGDDMGDLMAEYGFAEE
ncbi:hypothetical protein [Desulfuromonas sp. DDH964]|uniref:hypothetical protein n=1 Tax=Desulfuromonas sp. DDH964 TaxID=1823759 RepID=UPI0018D4647F|nr:hypothetical protein [Desulfuromonas sp. DDH964]